MPFPDPRRVLVPVDLSAPSLRALEAAAGWVARGAELHVVYVLPALDPPDLGGFRGAVDRERRHAHAEVHLRDALRERGLDGEVHVVGGTVGNPAGEVAAVAERIGAELVVVASRGRTGLESLLIGSVAERIVRLSPCPVLVLHPGD